MRLLRTSPDACEATGKPVKNAQITPKVVALDFCILLILLIFFKILP